MRRSSSVVLALAFVLVVATPSRARACINAVVELDKTVAALKDAERALNDGDPAGARDRLPNILWELDGMKYSPERAGLRDRASRVGALADVRLARPTLPGDRIDGTLESAVTALKRLADEHPNDAARLTDLGEALARTKPVAAKKILEDLAAHDVMTTPYGYAALARLRAADGDANGRDEALAKCRPMAKVAPICRLDPAPSTPAPSTLARVIPVAAVAVALAALALGARSARAFRARA